MFINQALYCYKANVSIASIYDINQLEAMQLAEAWREVSLETIWNCWHRTGILPEHLSAMLLLLRFVGAGLKR